LSSRDRVEALCMSAADPAAAAGAPRPDQLRDAHFAVFGLSPRRAVMLEDGAIVPKEQQVRVRMRHQFANDRSVVAERCPLPLYVLIFADPGIQREQIASAL
jgi:hypothetical protein